MQTLKRKTHFDDIVRKGARCLYSFTLQTKHDFY